MSDGVRIIHVFVSSPRDVREERAVLDKVVERINRTDCAARGARLELWKWEKNVVPKVGLGPQQEVNAQTPPGYWIYLGIMKHRFGTPTSVYGSGTEEEFNAALARWANTGRPWILFYFSDEKVDPAELDLEQYSKVRAFRKEMEKKGIFATYQGVRGEEGFVEKVEEHLRHVLNELAPFGKGGRGAAPASPAGYLRDLLDETSHIDIRGLEVGTGKAHRFAIEDLYITLTTTGAARSEDEPKKSGGRRSGKEEAMGGSLLESKSMPLHEALRHERLVVIGDPGAGKTTFLRMVAHRLCRMELEGASDAAEKLPGTRERTFPVLVKLNELESFIAAHRNNPGAPTSQSAAAWLPRFLAARSGEKSWDLDEDFFREKLEGGRCTVLLDGLDEASGRVARKRLVRLVEEAASTYWGCRLVVTSRPGGYSDDARVSGFSHARIDPMSDDAVETFLSRWCGLIYREAPLAADSHCGVLLGALRVRPDIRRMARNPVMLTALAVVHWNERRLPEQRADLYESIIKWLSRSREQRPNRETAEQTVVRLQELALEMQNHPDGMQTEVPLRWAAERMAGEWGSGVVDKKSIMKASEFLEAEELDSGIVVGRGGRLAYWHRSFQEFLAARAIAALPDAEQQTLLWKTPAKVYLPEWREVMLLLAGILHGHGRAKVNNLVGSLLERAEKGADLAGKARCVGMLGSMLRDLDPVGYKITDERYGRLREDVYAIFDRETSQSVPIEERIKAADALGQAGDRRLDAGNPEYWITIDAGEFLMGAQSKSRKKPNHDPDADDDETPVHEVYLHSFRIGRYPVTVGEYRRFVEDEGYKREKFWEAGGFGMFSEPENWEEQLRFLSRPVVRVSWFEAVAYCGWADVRLLTEAEWERAARGVDGRKYPWGNEEADAERLNYDGNIGYPTPVGIYPMGQSREGICDMAGNVWEWCADRYGEYPSERVKNPSGPKEGAHRVIRGGSWRFIARNCRTAIRYRREPVSRNDYLGFRVSPVPPGRASSGQTG